MKINLLQQGDPIKVECVIFKFVYKLNKVTEHALEVI